MIPADSAAASPTHAPIPPRVGRLLLAYGDHAEGERSELLVFPKAVGGHLCRLLCAAGYVTVAPHLGIFAGAAANPDLVVSACPPPSERLH